MTQNCGIINIKSSYSCNSDAIYSRMKFDPIKTYLRLLFLSFLEELYIHYKLSLAEWGIALQLTRTTIVVSLTKQQQ